MKLKEIERNMYKIFTKISHEPTKDNILDWIYVEIPDEKLKDDYDFTDKEIIEYFFNHIFKNMCLMIRAQYVKEKLIYEFDEKCDNFVFDMKVFFERMCD